MEPGSAIPSCPMEELQLKVVERIDSLKYSISADFECDQRCRAMRISFDASCFSLWDFWSGSVLYHLSRRSRLMGFKTLLEVH